MISAPFRRRPDVLWRRSLRAVVLLAPGSEEPISLAGTGVAVWELVDTWRTLDTLTELLATLYEAEPAVVRSDLEVLVVELLESGALELAADSGGSTAG